MCKAFQVSSHNQHSNFITSKTRFFLTGDFKNQKIYESVPIYLALPVFMRMKGGSGKINQQQQTLSKKCLKKTVLSKFYK